MVNDTEYNSTPESDKLYKKMSVRDSDSPKDAKLRGNENSNNNNTSYQGSRLQRIMRSPITLAGALIIGATLAYNSSNIYGTLSAQPRTQSTQSGTYQRDRSVTPKKEVDGLAGFGEIFREGVVRSFTRPFEHVGKKGVEIINETLGEAKERGLEIKAEKKRETGEKSGLINSVINWIYEPKTDSSSEEEEEKDKQ